VTVGSAPLSQAARALLNAGRAAEALALIQPAARRPDADYDVLSVQIDALRALGRGEEALTVHRRATVTWPLSVVAWHNLAACLGDLGHGGESRAAIDRALSVGGDAAATWLVRARACWMTGAAAEAETSYRKALARAPAMTDAACELAQLIWLQTADADAAAAPLVPALAAGADASRILFNQSQLLRSSGREAEAQAVVIAAARGRPDDLSVLLLGVRAAVETDDLVTAHDLVARAERIAPDHHQVLLHRTMVLMAEGRAAEALAAARQAAERAPHAQDAWGWVATAARAAGDPQHAVLSDYATLVRPYDLDTPPGWTRMEDFLDDLERALVPLHTDRTHRLEQSARSGTQTFGDLRLSADPTIQAFFTALDTPIRAYLAAVGRGEDPIWSRNSGEYRLTGAWSVRLGRQGHHIDHFHPTAWISSAFYVRVPTNALATDHQGWLRFGQSPFPSRPSFPADHLVRPAPGRLVLFPSYMWHGTVPFEGDETRLSIAFDVVPQ